MIQVEIESFQLPSNGGTEPFVWLFLFGQSDKRQGLP
jgi:hypothetical protein